MHLLHRHLNKSSLLPSNLGPSLNDLLKVQVLVISQQACLTRFIFNQGFYKRTS